MSLVALAALFFSFGFAVVGAAHLIHAFVAANNQVRYLRASAPSGTVLDIDRHGEMIWGISQFLPYHSRLSI